MRVHKMTIIYMALICICSLLAAFFLDSEGISFWANIAIGMFSSGFLALIIAVVAYRVERRKALEEFLSQSMKAISNIYQYDRSDKPIVKMETVAEMKRYDYSPLDSAYANIDFICFFDKTKDRIFNNIYSRINKYKNEITVKEYHFNMYLKKQHNNLDVMLSFLEELEDKLYTVESREINNKDGKVTKFSYYKQKVTEILNDENKSWYFKLMYGKKNEQLLNDETK